MDILTSSEVIHGTEGEGLFVRHIGDKRVIAANLHNHTTNSDGYFTIEQLAAIAAKYGINLAVTDHNVPPTTQGDKWYPGLIAGIEIQTKEGIDVLVLGTRDQVERIFVKYVENHVHYKNPMAYPVDVSIHQLMYAVRAAGAYCVFPHYANLEGLCLLKQDEQERVLHENRDIAFLERNAMMTKRQNNLAERIADEWGIPILSNGDTHRGENQHVSSYSALPADQFIQGSHPLVMQYLKAMHTEFHPDNTEAMHTLYAPTMTETLLTVQQVVRMNGVLRIATEFTRRSFIRWWHSAQPTLDKLPKPKFKLPLRKPIGRLVNL